MIVRPTLAAATAAFAVVGSASAAALVVNAAPTLASIVVDVPACGEASQTPGIPVAWIPERDCGYGGDDSTPEYESTDPLPPPPSEDVEPPVDDGAFDSPSEPPASGEDPIELPPSEQMPDDSAPPSDGSEPGAEQLPVVTPAADTDEASDA